MNKEVSFKMITGIYPSLLCGDQTPKTRAVGSKYAILGASSTTQGKTP